MRFLYCLLALCFLHTGLLHAQPASAAQEDQPIQLQNPSFEDFPRLSHTPRAWFDCGFPGESQVDVHPEPNSLFKVDKTSYHGDTYVGMVVRENETWEAIGQRLQRPIMKDKCYEFTMHLARSPMYMSKGRSDTNSGKDVNYATPAKLRIWGGNGYCAKAELLAESSLIINSRWLEFNFRFEPTQNISYITFEAFYKTPVLFPYNGNIILDNAQAIIPVPCDVEEPPTEPKPTDVPIASNDPFAPKKTEPKAPTPSSPPITETKPTETKATIEGKEKTDLKVGQKILISNLQFDADSIVIPPRSYEAMNKLLDFLAENEDLRIEVGGHTNGQPAHEYCDYISEARAKSVAEYLIERGIQKDRLTYKGYGKRDPIASNKTLYGRRKNQRVEIKILGFKGDG